MRRAAVIALVAGALALTSCAHLFHRQPSTAARRHKEPPPRLADTMHVAPRRPAAPRPAARQAMLGHVVRDTVALHAALRHCAGRNLLPDQENVYDGVRALLDETRLALAQGDVPHAQRAVRSARQLAGSLNCH